MLLSQGTFALPLYRIHVPNGRSGMRKIPRCIAVMGPDPAQSCVSYSIAGHIILRNIYIVEKRTRYECSLPRLPACLPASSWAGQGGVSCDMALANGESVVYVPLMLRRGRDDRQIRGCAEVVLPFLIPDIKTRERGFQPIRGPRPAYSDENQSVGYLDRVF
jgi:hypothetical protein